MITQDEKEVWFEQTKFMIYDTELEDDKFREKHDCHCKDRYISRGKYFCGALIRARMRNKPLMQRWMNNLRDSPRYKEFKEQYPDIGRGQ